MAEVKSEAAPVPEEAPMERVLVISAHPDDPEFGAGGTIAKLAQDGAEVYYLICTDGSQGGEDPEVPDEELIATRRREQCDAAGVLGVRDVVFLTHRDGSLAPNVELRRDITRQIRRFKPDLVITHMPGRVLGMPIGGSHPDHLAVGEATLAAVYPDARNPRAYREMLLEGLQPHKVREVWIPAFVEGDHFIDVSAVIELKIRAIECHRSQFQKPDMEPDAPAKWIRERLRATGEKAGFEYAEGFKRIKTA
jgi:LmbE family N-acetylglucosaminyl deacetylase